jgi:hypothetical protein
LALIPAIVEKKHNKLKIHPQSCPALLSVCLWKEKHENTWEEIEVCHAYRGHDEKEELVECAWEEVFSENRKNVGVNQSQSVTRNTKVKSKAKRNKRKLHKAKKPLR